MLIIVEGPPSSGKTAFAHQLRSRLKRVDPERQTTLLFGHDQANITLRGERYMDHYLQRLEDYAPGGSTNIVADEWHWANPAYTAVFSETSRTRDVVVDYVDLKLAQLGAVIVHRDPSTVLIQQRMLRRNPWLYPHHRILKNLHGIQDAYTKLAHRSITTVLPSTATPEDIVKAAVHMEKQAIHFMDKWPWYLGVHNPAGLLVDVDYKRVDTLMPRDHTGAYFLQRSLAMAHPEYLRTAEEVYYATPYQMFGMVNAAFMSPESLADLVKSLHNPKVIAMGSKVDKHIADIPHVTVPHHNNAIVHNSQATQYGKMLHRALRSEDGGELAVWPEVAPQ